MGAAVYAWLERAPRPEVKTLNGIGFACAAYLLAMGWFWEHPAAKGSDLVAVAVVLPLLSAACVVPGSVMNRLLTLPALVLLGDMSYSLYLVHLPIGKLLGEALEGKLGAPWMGILFFAILTGVAYALYRWVNVPTRQFSMRFTAPKQSISVQPKKAA